MYDLNIKYKKSNTQFKLVYTAKSEDEDDLLFTLQEMIEGKTTAILSNFLKNYSKEMGDAFSVEVKPLATKGEYYPHSLEIILGTPKLDYKTVQTLQKLVDKYLLKRAFDYMAEQNKRAANKLKQNIQDSSDKKLGIYRMDNSSTTVATDTSAALIGYVKSIKSKGSRVNSIGQYLFEVEISSKGKTLLQKSNKIQNMTESHRDIASGLFMGKFSSKNQDPARAKTAINSFFEYLELRNLPTPNTKTPTNMTPAKALKMFKDKGYKVVKNPSGSFTVTPPKK